MRDEFDIGLRVSGSRVLVDGKVEVSVTDNGIGIADPDAKRIFNPLERLHSKDEIEGTGLGLAICEKVMALHGGTIRLDVSQTTGARFCLVFPAEAQVFT